MSCYHRYWHGCDWPPAADWYDPYAYGYRPPRYAGRVVVLRDEDEVPEEPHPRRRRGSWRRPDERAEHAASEEVTAASLQARAEAMREELERIERDLRRLASEEAAGSET